MNIKVYAFKAEYRGVGESAKRIDWVNIGPIGLTFQNTTWYRIDHIRPRAEKSERDVEGIQQREMERRWAIIEKHYEAWLKGQELPVEGTPLAAWGGISKEVADAFIKAGVRTVEEISHLTEADKSRIPVPNVYEYVRAAKSFLDTSAKQDTNDRIKSMEDTIRQQAEELKAATELLEQMAKKPVKKDAA